MPLVPLTISRLYESWFKVSRLVTQLVASAAAVLLFVGGGLVLSPSSASAAGGWSIPPGWVDCLAVAFSPQNMGYDCTDQQWSAYFDLSDKRIAAGLPAAPEPWEYDSFSDYMESRPHDYSDPDINSAENNDAWDKEKERKTKPNKKGGTKPFTPSVNKPRAFMINVLGSVLKGATPDKWRREMLANLNRYNHSWEGLAAQFGTDPANPNYSGSPDKYDDYVLKNLEQKKKGGTKGKPMTSPATKASPLRKGVAGVGNGVLAITMMPIGFAIGTGITQMFGFDPDTGVCSQEDGFLRDAMLSITGANCSAWEFDNSYEINNDVDDAFSTIKVCQPSTSRCIELVGSGWITVGDTPPAFLYCVEYSGGGYPNNGWRGEFIGKDGLALQTRVAQPNFRTHNWAPHSNVCAPYWTGAKYASEIIATGPEGFLGGLRMSGPLGAAVNGEVHEPDLDPVRTVTCSIAASDGHTYTADSLPYREGSGSISPPQCPELPDGVRPLSVGLSENGPNGSTPMGDPETVTPEFAHWWDTYPECREGQCKLDLRVKPEGGGPAILSCFDLGQQCADWFEQPNKEDLYQCRYGIHDVVLAECAVYSGVFKPDRITVGAPYSDPETGEWSGGQSSPGIANDMMNSPVQNPDSARECFAEGWAVFNPVEWVLTPIRCAFEWAFVPRTTVIALEAHRLTTAFDGRAIGQIAGMVNDWDYNVSMAGCSITAPWAPTIPGQPGQLDNMKIVNVCPGSEFEILGTLAKVVTSVAFALMVFLAMKRYVGKSVDYT